MSYFYNADFGARRQLLECFMTNTRPIEPRDLYRLRLISDTQIAPDGGRVAFVLKQMNEEKNEYISNVYVVDREGTVRQFTSGDKDSAPRWSPDGKWLAFLSGRKDRAQIYLLSTGGGESLPLTERKFGAGAPSWSPDGKYIGFIGAVPVDPEDEKDDPSDKDPKKKAKTKILERSGYKMDGAGFIGDRRRHLFVVDVAKRSIEQLTEGDFNDNGLAWSPDSRHIAFSSNRSECWDVSTSSDIYVIPREGGQARRLTSDGAFGAPTFSPDGSRIGFIGGTEHQTYFEPQRLWSMARDGSDLRDEQGSWDGEVGHDVISDVVLPDDGLGFTWRDDGLYFLGTERGEANVYRASGGGVTLVTSGKHSIVDWSMAEDGTIACGRADSTQLAEVYLWLAGEFTQLTRENEAFLDEVRVIKPERISYAGANGEKSEGWLLAPPGHESGTHPLIVYLHGGPMAAYGESLFFEYQFLANQGYGVWYPNIHGSSTYGRDYQLSIRADWGNLDYQDVLASTGVVSSRDWVDAERLGIIGGSYGGYMTSWVMGHTDLFKAGVTERVLCNIVNFFGTMDFGFAWNRQTGAYPEEDIEKIWDMSPIKYVANVKGPLMVIHSEGDQRTPIEQGEQMFNALRRLGKKTKFIMFPEESHGLSRIGTPSRRVERMGYILDWFNEHL
jgi:dipeptidyl aminopeptidase/acylaminoacyl peptidase